MNKKRILIYIKDPKGGTGTFIKHLYYILITNHYDVLFVSHRNFPLDSINHQAIGFWINKQSGFSLKNLIYSLFNIVSFIKKVIIYKPSYIYSLDLYANVISITVKMLFFPNIYLIISTHVNLFEHINSNRRKSFSLLILSIIKWLYPKANLHISPSRELSLQVKKILKNDLLIIKTIPYPINRKKIVKLAGKKPTNIKYTLVTFSRLDDQKNVELLIQSVLYFNMKYKRKISLQIIGDGDLEMQIKNKYKNVKQIYFAGWRNNPFPYLMNASIFILISKYEGFGYSILEAMTLGKPVISSDVDYGPREIIGNNEYGLLTKNTVSNISNNIAFMLKRKKINYFKKQSLIRSKYFDLTKLNTQYLFLFNKKTCSDYS